MSIRKKIAGAVTVPKDIFDHPLLNAEPHCRKGAFADLQTLANDADRTTMIRGIPVPLRAGQLAWSQESLARRYGWSTEKFKRFLIDAQDARLLTYETTKLTTIITILDYEIYNVPLPKNDADSGTNSGTETGSEPGTDSETNSGTKPGQNWEVGRGSRKEEGGSAPARDAEKVSTDGGLNFPSIQRALEYFKNAGSDYDAEEIRAAWHSLNATARDGHWFRGRTPVGDWRSALETELATRRLIFAEKNSRVPEPDFHQKTPLATNVLSIEQMRRTA